METDPATPIATLRKRLMPFPAHRAVFEHALIVFSNLDDVGIGMSGSIARGQIDNYSDLDFWLAFPTRTELAAAKGTVIAGMRNYGRALAHFPAVHLAAPDLLIFFNDVDETIVKTDIELVTFSDFTRPQEFIALIDHPRIRFDAVPLRSRSETDIVGLSNRLAGWMWYTHAKLARGEIFEAASALDTMRALALVPLMRSVQGLPQEGYRRLERSLEESDVIALRSTYPGTNVEAEVRGALFRLTASFLDIAARLNTRDGAAGSDIVKAMRSAIERDLILRGGRA